MRPAIGFSSPASGISSLSGGEVRAEVERILASSLFARSKRLALFLRFTVDQALLGRQEQLKEYLVGIQVFKKLESFDPRVDSIVRVEARRLRSKLERYYVDEGATDNVVIRFRKGSYVPAILRRDQAAPFPDVAPPSTNAKRSIGVGEMANLSSEAAHTYFCQGMTEDIINALVLTREFHVVTKCAGHDGLHPELLVEGSVRKQGDRLRIAIHLVDTKSGCYIWSGTFDRETADVFAVQDEIAQAIVRSATGAFRPARN